MLKIKEIYDPDLDVTYVMQERSPTATDILGWYNGQPNEESTQAVVDQQKKGQ